MCLRARCVCVCVRARVRVRARACLNAITGAYSIFSLEALFFFLYCFNNVCICVVFDVFAVFLLLPKEYPYKVNQVVKSEL